MKAITILDAIDTKKGLAMLNKRFRWLDYWQMFIKRGIRLPLNYFLNAHLFDLIRNTDTHTWLPKELFEEQPQNFSSGVLYMTSWTNEIRRTYKILHNNYHIDKDYVFIDIGCGKGKVCLLWGLLEERRKQTVEIIGIDYYKQFINIAEQNYLKIFGNKGHFKHTDATEFDFRKIGKPIVAYLYNPFDEKILERVLANLPLETIVIYNNPVHQQTITKNGFELLYEHAGWHPNAHTSIFIKSKSTQQPL